MQKIVLLLALCFSICSAGPLQGHTAEPCYKNLPEVLSCFLGQEDNSYRYELLSTEKNESTGVVKSTYLLSSQRWPIKQNPDVPTTTWKHRLTFYRPQQMIHSKALLYVTGGYNTNEAGEEQWFPPKEQLEYENIALRNQALVMELQDVPNQYLWVAGQLKKEDQIIAYTYKKVMENPFKNAYLSGHLPMMKAIVKAMDAGQAILKENDNIKIDGFIVAGASKRGWAVWLAALEDDRIEAIMPIVIDLLNTQKSIVHTCEFYQKGCPPALHDYEKEGITALVKEKAFFELMGIEDPFRYLGNGYHQKYKKRLAIPKYIVNASGDDFFVPDSSRWYFKDLPGTNNYIRYLPNATHYFKGNPISDSTEAFAWINQAIQTYFYLILNKIDLPKISWDFQTEALHLSTSHQPTTIKLWVCQNDHERDFRFINAYTRSHLLSKQIRKFWSGGPLCDNCYTAKAVPAVCLENQHCSIPIPLPHKGWQASFAELHYNLNGIPFVASTEINVVPSR